VFSGLFFNGAGSWRDPVCDKNVVEMMSFNESVEPRRADAGPVGRLTANDLTRLL
jgi:hypothetical protein